MTAVATEPAWLVTLRADARARFDSMRWPTTSDEEWRRTDLGKLKLDSFGPGPAAKPACPREAETGPWSGVIRFEGTRCIEAGLSPAAAEKGARLLPVDLALEEFEAPLHRALHAALERADNRFIPWQISLLSHGAFLWIPAGITLEDPFLIELAERGPAAEGSSPAASAPHVQVVLGDEARAAAVLRITGGSGTLVNAGVSLRLGAAASLRFCEAQRLAPDALYFRHTRAEVARDASLLHFEAQFGAKLAKTRVDCDMAGPGADAVLDGVYYCDRGQHMDLRTVQNHVSPRATSRAYYKGAVAGGGRSVFQGLIEVAPHASGTDAFLTNRNLVLGEAARSDSIPTLRIGNNDVKCSHGSTTGRLSEEEIFYLESRGLSRVDAREMLVVGYFEDLLAPTPESFKNDALSVIRDRLRGAA